MTTRPKIKIERALRKKGFVEQQGDHHYYTYYTSTGVRTGIFTKTSHTPHMKEIPDNLLSQMAGQCKLSTPEFCNLVDCPLSREAYEKLLKEKHFI